MDVLVIDGRHTAWRVRSARRFWARFRGVGWRVSWRGFDVLFLPRCRWVHCFGLRKPIDVLFTDAGGTVIAVGRRVLPWRVVSHASARDVWEMPEGAAQALGIGLGTTLAVSPASGADLHRSVTRRSGAGVPARIGGAASLEFALAIVVVVWPLIAAVFELSQISLARHALSYAVYETARAETRGSGGDIEMRRRLSSGLLPLLGGVSLSANSSPTDVALAMSRTLRETLRPDLLTYSVSAVGPSAIHGVVMELRVTYCRELFFVPVKQFVPRLLAWVEDDPFDLACLARERIPLKSTATLVRMRATQVEVDAQASVVGSIG